MPKWQVGNVVCCGWNVTGSCLTTLAGSVPELNLGLVMYIILGVATALKLVSRCARKFSTLQLMRIS